MRAGSDLVFGEGLEGFVKTFSDFHAGSVRLFGKKRGLLEDIGRLLAKKGYKVYVDTDEVLPETFLVCADDTPPELLPGARSKFAYYATRVFPSAFGKSRGGYAEFVYIDKLVYEIDDAEKTADVYSFLLAAFTEGLAARYSDFGMPYTDRGLSGILTGAKEILEGKTDRRKFLEDALRTGYVMTRFLQSRGINAFLVENMARKLGGKTEDYFNSSHFLNMLLILFTKWNFYDILIPAERPVKGVAADKTPAYTEEDLFLNKSELNRIFSYARELCPASGIGIKPLIKAMKLALTDENRLFAQIYNRGIPEGLSGYG